MALTSPHRIYSHLAHTSFYICFLWSCGTIFAIQLLSNRSWSTLTWIDAFAASRKKSGNCLKLLASGRNFSGETGYCGKGFLPWPTEDFRPGSIPHQINWISQSIYQCLEVDNHSYRSVIFVKVAGSIRWCSFLEAERYICRQYNSSYDSYWLNSHPHFYLTCNWIGSFSLAYSIQTRDSHSHSD